MTRALLLIAVFFGLALPAQSQNTYNGSLYSRYGLGEFYHLSSAHATAMGGGGTALSSLGYSNFSNPAALGDQVLTRITFGGYLQGIEIRDAQDNRSRLSEGNLGAFQFSFPLYDRKLGVGVQYTPLSRVAYSTREEKRGVVLDASSPDTVDYAISFEGSGGLQRIDGGLGWAPSDRFLVGATANLIFGVIENGRRTAFETGGYAPSNAVLSTRLAGVTGTLGALGRFQNVLGSGDALHIGASVTLPATLYGRRVQTLGESLDRDTLFSSARGKVRLPLSTSLGVAYRADARWLFTLDGRMEPWSGFTSDFSWPGYDEDFDGMQDRMAISGGFEVLPAGNRPFGPYLSRVAYRLGARYEQAYVQPLAGEDLRTFAITGGLSLPTLLTGTRFDINLEAGMRGAAEGLLVQDRYYRIGLNVNIGERWFERQKLR